MKDIGYYLQSKLNGELVTYGYTDPADGGTAMLTVPPGVFIPLFFWMKPLLFWIQEVDGSYYRFTNRANATALDGDGSKAYLLSRSDGDNNQHWNLEDTDDGYKRIKHVLTGTFLTVEYSDNAHNVVLRGDQGQGSDSQKWGLSFQGYLVQKATERVVTGNDSPASMTDMKNAVKEVFFFKYEGLNLYSIILNSSMLFGDHLLALMPDSSETNHLSFKPYDKASPFLWRIEDMGNGFQRFHLRSNDNKVLDGDGTNLYFLETNGGDFQLWSQIVQMPVDLDKPYNQLTFGMAHDSHTDKKTSKYSDLPGSPMWEDQTQDIGEQLVGGIRAVRISTGFNNNSSETIVLLHSLALKNFSDYMERVRIFLDRNPTVVLAIYDEGDSSKSWYSDEKFENDLADQYVASLGGTTGAPNRILTPGLNNMPSVDALKAGNWPTLQQMIDNGVQIIVFMSNGFPKVQNSGVFAHPWILPSDDMMRVTPYDYLIQDDDMNYRPDCVEVKPTDAMTNQIFKFNHFFYSPINGKEESSQVMSKWTVGDLLIEDTLRAWKENNRPPNWINVDFYQGVKGATSYLSRLVRAINSSGSYEDLESKISGTVIQNTSIQIGNGYYQIVNMRTRPDDGKVYALNVQWWLEKYLPPYIAVGLASLSEFAPFYAPAQYWYFKYNTPNNGIQIFNFNTRDSGMQLMLHHQLLKNFDTPNGLPNLSHQSPDNIGAADTGWELYPTGDHDNPDTYWIFPSGDHTVALGVLSLTYRQSPSVGLKTYDKDDLSQRWKITPVKSN